MSFSLILTLILVLNFTNILHAQVAVKSTAEIKAQRMFEQITGIPLNTKDPRFTQMVTLINQGKPTTAAAIATEDIYFYQDTLKNFASIMSNKSETSYVPLDDFQATFIGAVRDNLDARTLLTGNYLYVGQIENKTLLPEPSTRDNKHYENIENGGLDYKSTLVKKDSQWGFKNTAGLLTTRAWAKAHYDSGTNRRAVKYAFQEFLCAPIETWKTPGLSEKWIGRDVDRAAGNDPKVFQDQCKTCHAPMDSMRDAFAYQDFVNEGYVQLPLNRTAPKYARGATKYPEEMGGHVTRDDSWVNLMAAVKPYFGFKSFEGKGINAFGQMLANSESFKTCMVERVFKSICQREPLDSDKNLLTQASQNFEKNSFNLKKTFQEIAASNECTGE